MLVSFLQISFYQKTTSSSVTSYIIEIVIFLLSLIGRLLQSNGYGIYHLINMNSIVYSSFETVYGGIIFNSYRAMYS